MNTFFFLLQLVVIITSKKKTISDRGFAFLMTCLNNTYGLILLTVLILLG